MTTCERFDTVRDYAFGEVPAAERAGVERHLTGCPECSAELDRLRMTVASLRALPDQEIPQRIAFVSDKVFEPSPLARFFAGVWNSTARLGFASAAQASNSDIDAAVAKAVARVRAEDNAAFQTTLASLEERHKKEHQSLLVAVQENLDVMQKRMGAYTSLASLETPRENVGQ